MIDILGIKISLSEIVDSIGKFVKLMHNVDWDDIHKFGTILWYIFLFITGIVLLYFFFIKNRKHVVKSSHVKKSNSKKAVKKTQGKSTGRRSSQDNRNRQRR